MSENEHEYEGSRLLACCLLCGLRRMRKGRETLYAYRITGPWKNEEPECKKPPVENPWRSKTILFGDVETTGTDWTEDEIVEYGFVVGRVEQDGSVTTTARTQSIVRPLFFEKKFSRERFAIIEGITGIRYEEVTNGVSARDAAAELARFIDEHAKDAVFASYNVAFDKPFFSGSLFLRYDIPVPSLLRGTAPYIDPYRWVQKIDRYVKEETPGRHKLTRAALRYGLIQEGDDTNAHRADYDAELGLRLLAHLAPEVPEDFDELQDWQRCAEGEWAANYFGKYRPKQRKLERLERMKQEQNEKEWTEWW